MIRGPQSTLYGADAIGGVVNIITKKGKGPFSATVEGGAGNYDTYTGRGWFSGAYSFLDYAGSISHLESNGQFKNDSSDKNAVNLRLGVSLPWDSSIAFTLRWDQNATGVPVKFLTSNTGALPNEPIIDSNAHQLTETWVMALNGRTKPVEWWEAELRLGRYESNQAFMDAPDAAEECPFPPFCEFPGRFKTERWEAELLNHFHIGPWSTSTIGLEYRTEDGEAQGSSAFDGTSHTKSVFFQQTFRLWDRLFMSAGFRVEDNSIYGTHWTERGSLAYVIREWGTQDPRRRRLGFPGADLQRPLLPGVLRSQLEARRQLRVRLRRRPEALEGPDPSRSDVFPPGDHESDRVRAHRHAAVRDGCELRQGALERHRVRLRCRHPRQSHRVAELHLSRTRKICKPTGPCRVSRRIA